MIKKITSIILLILLVTPAIVYGACVPGSPLAPSSPPEDFEDFVCYAINFIEILIPIAFVVGFIIFFWGIISFIRAGGDEKQIESGKKLLLWGSIILFVMISFWGVLQVFSNSLFSTSPIGVPLLPTNIPSP